MTEPTSAALEDPQPHPPAVAIDEAHVPHERPVSLPALYKALWHHAEGMRKVILGAFLLLLASQLFKLFVPWLAGNAINAIQSGGLGSLPSAARWLALVFAAIVASWLPIYAATPYPQEWHLATSLDRLLLQLLPATLASAVVGLASITPATER